MTLPHKNIDNVVCRIPGVGEWETSKFEIDIDFDERSQNLPQTIASFEAIKALAEKSNDPIELKEYQKLVEDLKKADTVFSIFNMK